MVSSRSVTSCQCGVSEIRTCWAKTKAAPGLDLTSNGVFSYQPAKIKLVFPRDHEGFVSAIPRVKI